MANSDPDQPALFGSREESPPDGGAGIFGGEAQLIAKLRAIEGLFARATVPGEAVATDAARERIKDRLEVVAARDPAFPHRFTFRDLWSRKVFLSLLRRYGLRPYRLRGQRLTTVMADVPASFVNETLWPEFEQLNVALRAYLLEVTDRVIAAALHDDGSDASETAGAPTTRP